MPSTMPVVILIARTGAKTTTTIKARTMANPKASPRAAAWVA